MLKSSIMIGEIITIETVVIVVIMRVTMTEVIEAIDVDVDTNSAVLYTFLFVVDLLDVLHLYLCFEKSYPSNPVHLSFFFFLVRGEDHI